ncbi:glycosyltransferase [Rothia sp. ARF10]|nr:glycosyltransferase [Rothia sp. ARF10]
MAVKPRLSVVVPFFRVEDYIGACLESVRRQTFTDLEVVMVDDGSTDGSRAIADDFVARDPRFRIVEKQNEGIGPARNTGAANAIGEFMTFVDSDDLVPWTAFEKMLDVIESTGSSLVAGNARRFNRSGGVRPSWAHRIPFQRTQLATHITASPSLVLDRMVWNKIYRRSFWESHDFTFPSIRYEDYPIALLVQLEALTVDVLSDPVYYWRERESGDSITQQTFQPDNLADRVTSAEMVFEIADRAGGEVRREIHRHLAEIDLTALVQAFEVVPDHEVDALVALGHRFVDRLDPVAVEQRPRFDRVQFAALRSGDASLLRELATFRSAGQVEVGRLHRNTTKPWVLEAAFPGRTSGRIPRSTYRIPRSSLTLSSTVDEVRWTDSHLVVRGTAHIRHLDVSRHDRLSLSLVTRTGRIGLDVTRLEVVTRGGREVHAFEATLPYSALEALPVVAFPAAFQVRLQHQYLGRALPLRGLGEGSPRWPGGFWSGNNWIQTGVRHDGALSVVLREHPARVDEVTVDDDVFVIRGRVAGLVPTASLQIVRPAPLSDTLVPAVCTTEEDWTTFTVRLRPEEISRGEVPADPYTLATVWFMRLSTPDEEMAIVWPGGYEDVSVRVGAEVYTMGASSQKWLSATKEPVRVRVHDITLDAERLVCSGPWWPGATPMTMSWRHFLPNSDAHVDVPCELEVGDGHWTASVPTHELVDRVAVDDVAHPSEVDWSLFVDTGTSDEAVDMRPRVSTHLPLGVRTAAAELSVVTVRNTVHVRVRR